MYRAKTTWGAGDYPLMAQALEPASARVIDAVNVSAGQRLIDVATSLSWSLRLPRSAVRCWRSMT